MANEVRIKLTDTQKAQIKEATGKDLPEVRVENMGGNPAFSAPGQIAKNSAKFAAKFAAKASAKTAAKASAKTAAKDRKSVV